MSNSFPILVSWYVALQLWRHKRAAILVPVLKHHHAEWKFDAIVRVSNDNVTLWELGHTYPLYSFSPRAPVRYSDGGIMAFPRFGGAQYAGYIGVTPDDVTFPAGDTRKLPDWRTIFVRVEEIRLRGRDVLSRAEIDAAFSDERSIRRATAAEFWWIMVEVDNG